MATVDFPTHGPLEILMDLSFINPLEALVNWTKTGPKFTLGDKISSLATPVAHGVVHGFVIQTDGTSTVLIWSDTDRYVQYPTVRTRSSLALWAHSEWTHRPL